jgi:hypothetical protein
MRWALETAWALWRSKQSQLLLEMEPRLSVAQPVGYLLYWLLHQNLARFHEICALLGYYAALSGSSVPTFRDNLSVAYSRVKKYIYMYNVAHAVGQLVEALRYMAEGRGFDSRWCHWNFSLTKSFRQHYGPGVHSASNRNEYQEYFLGVKAAGA